MAARDGRDAERAGRSAVVRMAMAAVVACWAVALVVPPVMLGRVRATWLEELDRPERQAEWDVFRADMRRQSGRDGPVQRKVPRSAEPPVRVWLRDHFALAVVAWTLFVGVLGGVLCLMIIGTLANTAAARQREGHPGDTQRARGR